MTVFLHVLLFLHMIGWAIVLGAAIVGLRSGSLYAGAFHGALTALVTGILMVLVQYVWLDDGHKPAPAWIATKIVLSLAITGLVWFAHAKPDKVGRTLVGTVGVLAVVTVGVATIWH
ncbi:MAG TPA: hypothetical protein VGC04_02310 [Cellulomonas sp.]